MERLRAIDPNLYISEAVPDNLSVYDFVIIDSVSRAGFDLAYLRQLRQDNPRTSFIFNYHTIKDGNFRGKNENAHEVDVIINIFNFIHYKQVHNQIITFLRFSGIKKNVSQNIFASKIKNSYLNTLHIIHYYFSGSI